MKKTALIFTLCLMALAVQAQHETLFNKARVVGGFGGPIVEMGLGNDMTTAVGGGGGLVINSFFFGGYGISNIDFNSLIEDEGIDRIELAHSGFWLGYSYPTHRLIHMYTSARLGWGAVDIDTSPNSNFPKDIDNVFVFTPELGLELNVARWFRITGTAGYRLVDGVNEARSDYRNSDFSGLTANVTFRFGWFGWRQQQ